MTPIPLNTSEASLKQFYEEHGYLLLKGVFSESEMREMQQESEGILSRLHKHQDTEATWGGKWREEMLAGKKPGQYSVASIHNVQYHSAVFTRVLVDERITRILALLIGPNVQLHHTKLHIKPPEIGSPFPMHQDHPYFPHENKSMTAVVIHIDDATVENGCLCVMPGSHKLGPLPHISEGSHYLPTDKYPLEAAVPVPAKAGDVLIFSYLTIHSSGVNQTNTPRRIVLYQFRSPTDHPTVETHLSPGQGTMVLGYNPESGTLRPR
jgi:ectoine hydroxylase-related dioxygenase (phytanoyl-CoA dioxygenase family)